MNYANIATKSSLVLLSSVVCVALAATDASAQRRGGGGGGGSRGSSGGSSQGRAVPRGSVSRGSVGRPVVVSPRGYGYGRAPYRSYYYRPGFSLGFYAGFPYYSYYGYPYGYYRPYAYGYYGYGYPGYYGGYAYPSAGYGYGGGAYGGVRIQGAPRDAQVFVDGYYSGIVDDFDGSFQHLDLEAGAHNIEVRMGGAPPLVFDVNVQPGRTVTIHAR
jgi:hypothetical protein